MDGKIILYHGSQEIVETPTFGKGRVNNDYGPGFYCTESLELAKEWACPVRRDGYVSKYVLDTAGLEIVYVTRGEYTILNWLALLLKNRLFDTPSPVSKSAKEYIISNFLPDTSSADVAVGYRADDSYFSFAEAFINNSIPLSVLSRAMELGKLGEQVVLISPKAFGSIKFLDYEKADHNEYFWKRRQRDREARNEYQYGESHRRSFRD